MSGKPAADLSGQRFGMLTVIGRAPDLITSGYRKVMFRCRCDCGAEKVTQAAFLRGGASKSCGCLGRGKLALWRFRHGHAASAGCSAEYRAWNNMRQRCNNVSLPGYEDYGGRGIHVCAEWDCSAGFPAFLEYVGRRPSAEHSLDRIDVNGNYEPGNVRWATRSTQMRNRRPHIRHADRMQILDTPGALWLG